MEKTGLLFLLAATLVGVASCTYSKTTGTGSVANPSNIVSPTGGGTDVGGATTAGGSPTSTSGLRVYQDSDGDGYGNPAQFKDLAAGTSTPAGFVTDNTDCNDHDRRIHPGAKRPSSPFNVRMLMSRYRMTRMNPYMIDWSCNGTYGYLPATKTDTDSTSKLLASQEYSFDAGANKLTMKNHGDGDATVTDATEWTFDANGNQTAERDYPGDTSKPVSLSLAWTYDAQGNPLTSRQYDGDIGSNVTNAVAWTYDVNGKPLTILSYTGDMAPANLDTSLEMAYDAGGNLLTVKVHQGDLSSTVIPFSIEYAYDANGNLSNMKIHKGDLSDMVENSAKWTYDASGNTLTEEDHDGDLSAMPPSASWAATYDANGNQTSIVMTDGKGKVSSSESTYDDKGNSLILKNHDNGGLSSPVTQTTQSSGYFPLTFRWNPDTAVRYLKRE